MKSALALFILAQSTIALNSPLIIWKKAYVRREMADETARNVNVNIGGYQSPITTLNIPVRGQGIDTVSLVNTNLRT